MITITHAGNGCYGVKPCLPPCVANEPCSCAYALGFRKPHYPVPATMTVSIKANGLYFYLVYRYRLWGKQGFR